MTRTRRVIPRGCILLTDPGHRTSTINLMSSQTHQSSELASPELTLSSIMYEPRLSSEASLLSPFHTCELSCPQAGSLATFQSILFHCVREPLLVCPPGRVRCVTSVRPLLKIEGFVCPVDRHHARTLPPLTPGSSLVYLLHSLLRPFEVRGSPFLTQGDE
jgi:hypothetical protein